MIVELPACEICGGEIDNDAQAIRVVALACESDHMTMTRELVMGTFHSKCVVETFWSTEHDEVPYIYEAREVLELSPLCECCKEKIERADRPSFQILKGGRE